MKTTWGNSKTVRSLARHQIGRKVLAMVGPSLIECPIENFKMLLDLKDQWGVSKYILKHGRYDTEHAEVVLKLLPPNSTCVDIGANIGYWSAFLVRQGKASKVIAIEPEPKNVELLNANVKLNKLENTVDIHACALGSEKGSLKLFLSEDNAGDHQLYATTENRKAVEVPVYRLDDLIGDKPVQFIKMDIQGYEPFAIDGMTETLNRNPDLVILTEWWPAGIKRAGRDSGESLRALEANGMKFYLVDPKEHVFKQKTIDQIHASVPEGHHVDLFITRRDLPTMQVGR